MKVEICGLTVEVEVNIIPGDPGSGPTYDCGGTPPTGPDVEYKGAWVLDEKGNRIDAFHMALKPSEALKRTAYEIKTSRSDFRREIQEPRKRRAAMRVSNQFFFVAPVGVIPHTEIPLDCGLMEFDGTRIFVTIQAPYRDSLPASWHFFAAFARRLIRAADPVKA